MELWLADAAHAFWSSVGEPEPFPRALDSAVWVLPLALDHLSGLRVSGVRNWLARRSIGLDLESPERRLHACLVAAQGHGCILLDGSDPQPEQRFSLAHELAHFLLDYHQPRARAMQRLGPGITAVLDGRRLPTVAERLEAVLVGVTIGPHTHLMARRPDGLLGCGPVAGAEHRADRLALELLAPEDEVRRRLAAHGQPATFHTLVGALAGMLTADFGLPRVVSASYADALAHDWRGGPSFREWLSNSPPL